MSNKNFSRSLIVVALASFTTFYFGAMTVAQAQSKNTPTPLYEKEGVKTQGRNFFFNAENKTLTYESETEYTKDGEYPDNTRILATEVVDCAANNMGRVVFSTKVPGKSVVQLPEIDRAEKTTALLAQLRANPANPSTLFNSAEGVYIAKLCAQYQQVTYNTIEESRPLVLEDGRVVGSAGGGGLTATKPANSAPSLSSGTRHDEKTSKISAKDNAAIPRGDFKHLKSNDFAHIFAGNFNYTPQFQVLQFDTLAYAIDDRTLPAGSQILSHLVLSCSEMRGTSFRTQVKVPGQKLQVLVKPEDVNVKTRSMASRLGLYPGDMKATFDGLCAHYMDGAAPLK